MHKEGIRIKIIDITRSLLTAPLYPGSIEPRLTLTAHLPADEYNETIVHASVHTATHADAPSHYLDSPQDITQMPLSHYIGACFVVEWTAELITAEMLKSRIPSGCRRLLLKGGGKSYFTEEAAQYLIDQRVRTVGTDAWSVGPLEDEASVHCAFLRQPVAILENLDLSQAEEGWYFLSALPIKLDGSEGAFVRAVLLEDILNDEKI